MIESNNDRMYYIIQYNKDGEIEDIWCEPVDEYRFSEVLVMGDVDDYIRIAVEADNLFEAIDKGEQISNDYFERNPENR